MKIDPATLEAKLLATHGEAQKARIEQGVRQVASLWRKEDGDLGAFVTEHFLADPARLDATFQRFQTNLEQVDGHLLEIGRELRRPTELDLGPLEKLDPLFAAWDPSAHLTDDLFSSKLAFVALLNFPLTTLDERLTRGPSWTRRQWAEARLTGRFSRRVPAEVQQGISASQAAADLYIAEYNVWMHHVLSESGERLFPKGKRLITHWNLRDELKAQYADPKGLARQRTIIRIMERIVTQTIPAAVIDNPRLDWNPFTNAVTVAPADTVEGDAPKRTTTPSNAPEADVRYQRLWANYTAQRKADPFSPVAPTAIDRAFALGAEMPEARVKQLLESVLQSPQVPKVAQEIQQRLGRPLEPTDLWFNGFLPRGAVPEAELDAKTRARYPTAEAFAKDIPRILTALGFPAERAKYLAERIKVDASRGAGHAMQSARRGDFPRLRTRVEKEGMNYKGYNIAVHELGHNVEQVFSLYDVDHTLLAGVPNTAFTEAIAFVFQARDLELLGLGKPSAEQERLRVLNDFWSTWEIAGVALVDLEVWHWMYDHPNAKPAELRDATVSISKRVWNQHYAPVLGGKDTPLLGIYSHMISYPLYLFNYPLGHLIAFQIEEQVNKQGVVGPELERMAKQGAVTPDVWMTNAAGGPVSAEPLLRATDAALATPQKQEGRPPRR
ncbi:MAG: hypothetical protein JNJ54_27090 [Myxococcaceae bacterium]|nr:hypothetical protein [Myxococcaceae bacterium]